MVAGAGVSILKLTAAEAVEFWPELQPYVLRALEYDHYNQVTLPGLVEQLRRGLAQTLVAADANGNMLSATVLMLHKTKSGERVLHVIASAGDDSARWLPQLIEKFHEIARQEGATSVTMTGRPGWGKKLHKFGFRVAQVDMRMAVIDEHEQKSG